MHTKLHIEIHQGIVDVEGDPEFVREIYADFKDTLLAVTRNSSQPAGVETENDEPPAKPKATRRARARDRAPTKETTNGMAADSPKMDKNLDASKLGDFFAQFEPKNNAEKILIYLKFITEELEVDPPNTDQVFTCFKMTGEKIPKAFAQAFYDTSSKHGYIDFNSATDISITIAGENHFNHGLKKKAPE